jgi:HK97 family phage major capsid protein
LKIGAFKPDHKKVLIMSKAKLGGIHYGYETDRKDDNNANPLSELAAKFQTNATEIKNAQAKLEDEVRANGTATAETKTALETAQAAQTELKGLFEAMDAKLIAVETELKRFQAEGDSPEFKTAGDIFVTSEIFDGLKSAGRGTGMPLTIDTKDITSLPTSAGALIRPDRDPEVYRNPNRPTRIRDLIPSIPTSSGSVEFMRQSAFTNNAAPQGTVAGQGGGEFVAKAQSNLTWELVVESIKTVAHWVPASRQALSDAPQLKSLIDIDLEYGLDLESDVQLLLGDGSNQNMTGLLVDADVSNVGEIANGTAPADVPAAMIDHIRAAVTECQTNEYYNTNGVVLNPVDWEILETAKATDGHYLMISMPGPGAEERIWRMPVIITNAMPADNFILGDWMMGAKIYDREQKEIRVSESHADYFVKNGVAILAEERYSMVIPRPKAFCKGLFTVAAV